MKKRILFVDDETSILRLIEHLLKPKAGHWELLFAQSGQEALQIMAAHHPVDVIVSDIRMPGMDGAELLRRVEAQYPRTVRMAFSGVSEPEMIYRLVGTTHQFLLKPNDVSLLRNTIEQALAMQDILSKDQLEKVVSRIQSLPSLPDLYVSIVEELKSANPSIDRVGAIISQDIAMSAKLLQLVNSAFFGLRQHVSSAAQAAALLGLDTLKSLVLLVHVFTELKSTDLESFSLRTLWDHSLSVGVMSREIALEQGIDEQAAEDAFIAGLFHDIGKLVLAANLPEEYRKVIVETRKRKTLFTEIEAELLGATHGEVGGYLLGIWGFAPTIIEACAYHHTPTRSHDMSFGPLTTVHVANVLDLETRPPATGEARVRIDQAYLAQLCLDNRLDAWRKTCAGSRGQNADD